MDKTFEQFLKDNAPEYLKPSVAQLMDGKHDPIYDLLYEAYATGYNERNMLIDSLEAKISGLEYALKRSLDVTICYNRLPTWFYLGIHVSFAVLSASVAYYLIFK